MPGGLHWEWEAHGNPGQQGTGEPALGVEVHGWRAVVEGHGVMHAWVTGVAAGHHAGVQGHVGITRTPARICKQVQADALDWAHRKHRGHTRIQCKGVR